MFKINQTIINDFTDKINAKEKKSNKVTSLSSSSTDTQYPSAKAVYDALQNGFSGDYNDLTNKPTIPNDVSDLTDSSNTQFTPKSHTHGYIQNNGTIDIVNGSDTHVLSEGPTPIGGGPATLTGDFVLFVDKSDSYKIKMSQQIQSTAIKNSIALANIGSSANENQYKINSLINTALGNKANTSALSDYIQKSNTVGLVKNDGTIDTSTYLTSHQSLNGYLQTTDVVDNLTSTSATTPLSAKQGKEIKTLLDGKSSSSHTHNIFELEQTTYSGENFLTEGTDTDGYGYDISGKIYYNESQSKFFYDKNGFLDLDDGNELATMNDIPSLTNYVQKSNTTGLVKNDGTIDTTTYLSSHQDISGKEDASNKTSSWSNTTNDTRYPTEKLVKDSLDTKAESVHTHTSLQKTQEIGSSADLNTFTNTGWYSYSTTNSNTISNVPTKVGSVMEVFDDYANGRYVIQIVYTLNSAKNPDIYYRQKYDTSGWGDWIKVVKPSDKISDINLTWDSNATSNSVSPLLMATGDDFNANRLAYFPPERMSVQYSTDGGTNWSTYTSIGNENKQRMTVSCKNGVIAYLGNNSSADRTKNQLRITFDCGDINTNSILYMIARKIAICSATNNSTDFTCQIQTQTYAQYNTNSSTFSDYGSSFSLGGNAGWNSYPIYFTIGGNSGTQTNTTSTRIKALRLLFTQTGGTGNANVQRIRLYGETAYRTPSQYGMNGHLYYTDINQNAVFPSKIIKENGTSSEILLANGDVNTKVTSWQSTPSDSNVPSEKLVKDYVDDLVGSAITYIVGSGN